VEIYLAVETCHFGTIADHIAGEAMNLEVEAAGAFVTAGLGAHEIDGGAQSHAQAHGAPAVCPNCQAPDLGKYCRNCGQSSHIHHSLLHLAEEVLHGVLHFDAKGWRTLPLLIARPGQLTRRYVDGQRTRYVSPLALFLFMIFLMFFVVSATSGFNPKNAVTNQEERAQARIELAQEVEQNRASLAAAEVVLAEAVRSGKDKADAEQEVADARRELAVAQDVLRAFDVGTQQKFPKKGSVEAKQQTDLSQNGYLKRHSKIGDAIRHAAENPELTIYKLKNTAYKFSFMLVPISLPFLWLLFFRRRDVTMYEHAVFSLYSISFMSLLFIVLALTSYAGWTALSVVMLFTVPPLHMFLQLRGTYALSVWSALWRTGALLFVTATVFLLYLCLILLLTVH